MADVTHKILFTFSTAMFLFALMAVVCPSVVTGQQVGVSLKLQGVSIPNNSLLDITDLLYTSPYSCCNIDPSNARPDLHDLALLCVTDLVDCCDSPRRVHGDWYYPDGHRVEFTDTMGATFQANRGSNEVINGRQFYGSVRLYRRWSNPPERGRFRCELPSAADPTNNVTLYVHILNYIIGVATISPSGSSTAGGSLSLVCLANITTDPALPNNAYFEWFFGLNNSSLPSGLTPMATVFNGTTFTSILHFFPLSQSHVGMYTCRLGGNPRIAARATLIVNAPPITVMVTANLNTSLMVGQTGNTLTCDIFGAERLSPTITYQWTRNDGSTQTQVGTNSATLPLSPLQLSDAGNYSCSITSTLLNNPVSAGINQSVIIQIPHPQSVTVTSSEGAIILKGLDVILICSVRMNQTILASELSLLIVNAQLIIPNGSTLELSNPVIDGTTYMFITLVNSFGDNDIGNYTCMATVRPQPTSTYLTGTSELSNTTKITIGKRLSSDSKALGTCSSEVGIAVGVLTLMEVIIAGVIVVLYWIVRRYRKSGRKSDFAVSTNMAYGQVKLDTLRDVGGEYEDPDRLAKPGQSGGGNYEPTGRPAPYELPVSKPEAPVYATADETIR